MHSAAGERQMLPRQTIRMPRVALGMGVGMADGADICTGVVK